MATVIDSLVVKLGLDGSGFERGQKKVEEGLDQTRKRTEKVGKQIQASGKTAADFFGQMRKSALLLFGALAGARTLTGFVQNTIKLGANLDRSSKSIGVSANTLSKWGSAVKISGGSMEGFLGTMQGLNQQMTQLKETGDAPMRMLLNRLGVAAADSSGKAKDVITLTEDIAKGMERLQGVSESDKFNWLLGAGFDESTARLMLMSEKERTALIAKQVALTDEQARKLREMDEKWTAIKEKFAGMARDLMMRMLPAVERLSGSLEKTFNHIAPIVAGIVDNFAKLNEYTDGWLAAILAGVAALKAAQALMPGGKTPSPASPGTAAAAGGVGAFLSKWLKRGVGLAALTYSGDLNENEAEELERRRQMAPTIDAGAKPSGAAKGSNISFDMANEMAAAERANGLPSGLLASIIQQETGGRKEFFDDPAKYHYERDASGKRKSSAFGLFGILDSTAKDPGYGVSPLQNKGISEQIRFAAQYAAARIKQSGGDIAKGIGAYGEGSKYASQVLGRLPGGVMSGVSGSQGRMTGGDTNITVGNVVVQTQATDASGIARELHAALVRQADSSTR